MALAQKREISPFYRHIAQQNSKKQTIGVPAIKQVRVDINPLVRILIYAGAFDMCYRTRYAHCVSADLYHIELERSESISNLPRGKYIEPNGISTKSKIASVFTQRQCLSRKEDEEF